MYLLGSKTLAQTVISTLIAFAILAFWSEPLAAATPGIISYQGRVLVNNTPFNGTGQFNFALVDGTGSTTYWSNDNTSTAGSQPTAVVSVTVTNGLYSVLLGDTTIANMTNAIPVTVFANNDVRLRVWFNDGTNGSKLLAPDQRIVAVGFAITAGSVDAGSIGTTALANSAVTQAKLANGVTAIPSGTASGDLSGSYPSPTVATVGGVTAANVASGANTANAATNANTASTIVKRDASGNFSVGTVTGKLSADSDGSGTGLQANSANSSPAAFITSSGSGTGNSGRFETGSGTNNSVTLSGLNQAMGSAGRFEILNATNATTVLIATTNGTGAAGILSNSNAANVGPVLQLTTASTNGSSNTLVISNPTNGGNFITMQAGGGNKARIDITGHGFFDGGTTTSGADVAELFDVEGPRSNYEPGDVLILSTTQDRRVLKSSEPYSQLVSGVHATKPGVTLGNVDTASSPAAEKVPMGVVGVIPTKVCAENGPIKIGDPLVTSSTPGHAMKGTDRDRMMGATIGKAMQNFSGPGTGKINVLVNVK